MADGAMDCARANGACTMDPPTNKPRRDNAADCQTAGAKAWSHAECRLSPNSPLERHASAWAKA